jgi:subtilisin family serine protease
MSLVPIIAMSIAYQGAMLDQTVHIPAPTVTMTIRKRGINKISGELSEILDQYSVHRGPRFSTYLSKSDMVRRFGPSAVGDNPVITLEVTLTDASAAVPDVVGVSQTSRVGRFATFRAHVKSIGKFAESPVVESVQPIHTSSFSGLPSSPVQSQIAEQGNPVPSMLPNRGKGVAVGVIDSGIEWAHSDFRTKDGKSRILEIWDIFDNSYQDSGGKVGTKPPIQIEGKPLGTVYTRAQIDAALEGKATVATRDAFGHGTAVASVAAGNGLGAGDNAKQFQGIAPEADLIIVRAGQSDSMVGDWITFVQYIATVAAKANEPVAINISAGNHGTAHEGKDPMEEAINSFLDQNKNVSICVAAGNEGGSQLHTEGLFSPNLPGRIDAEGTPVLLTIRTAASLPPKETGSSQSGPSNDAKPKESQKDGVLALFRQGDEWGLELMGDAHALRTPAGNPMRLIVKNLAGELQFGLSGDSSITQEVLNGFASWFHRGRSAGWDELAIDLPDGNYVIVPFGAGTKVDDGRYSFYVQSHGSSFFAHGAKNEHLVASPGSASNVITVGAYVGLTQWKGPEDQSIRRNLPLGSICEYSSPGYRLDSAVKPEVVAPGTYWLSAKAEGSVMATMSQKSPTLACALPKYLPWEGTSAATPYVTGLIAVMLAKNPTLSNKEIREILIKTAKSDVQTGVTPNPQSGYGKVDPIAALETSTTTHK